MPQDVKQSALLLVRTPLQAWIAVKILSSEGVSNYDLVYVTQQDSTEDRYYFHKLSSNSENSQYCFAPLHRFDIFNHLDFYRQAKGWCSNLNRDLVIMSSIDSHVINAISSRQNSSKLVTFDDGLGNILPTDQMYKDSSIPWRTWLYRKLFGGKDIKIIKRNIIRHYTLYPQFENIVDRSRLKTLQGWVRKENNLNYNKVITYFVGDNFEELLSSDQIKVLLNYLKTLKIDLYVRHPREKNTLQLGIPYLDKKCQIAEDAIIFDAGMSQIHIIGWFSAVLFNLGEIAQRRTMLLVRTDPNSNEMSKLAARAGCEIILI
jgi:hypothetical protein